MLLQLKRLSRVLTAVGQKLRYFSDSVPVIYFDSEVNVGDAISPYLIKKISGKDVYRIKTNFFSHVLGVGSTLGSASKASYIWGAGSIDGQTPKRGVARGRVRALRGECTLGLVRAVLGDREFNVPLGDPALLMPLFFFPSVTAPPKKIGVVPHLVDRNCGILAELSTVFSDYDLEIIDVGQEPEKFITSLCSCEIVISSSLHGLILSDAYNIPNIWVEFSNDKIIGGRYKF